MPPQASLLFFKGTKGDKGDPGAASTVPGPDGPEGIAGPIGVYRGNYVSTTAYFDTIYREDIVAYAGHFWRTNNPLKNGTATWEAPNITDWVDLGVSFNVVATEIQLLFPAEVNVGINVDDPGYIKSDNFVQFVSGWLGTGLGRFEAYDALIAGQLSTNSPRFNLASVTRTMPATGYAEFEIPAILDAAIPVNPTINNVTDDALIIFGWLQGANNFIENRFGNTTQKFQINVQGIGTNTSAGTDLFYVELYYRTRTSGGAWGAWTQIGQAAYMQKLAGLDQSFQNTQPLRISLIGTQDIQFSAGFSKGAAGTASVGGAKISVMVFN